MKDLKLKKDDFNKRRWELARPKHPLIAWLIAAMGVAALIASTFLEDIPQNFARYAGVAAFAIDTIWLAIRYWKAPYTILLEQLAAKEQEINSLSKLLSSQETYQAGCDQIAAWIDSGVDLLNEPGSIFPTDQAARAAYSNAWRSWVVTVREGAKNIDKNLGHRLYKLGITDPTPLHLKYDDTEVDLGIRMLTTYLRLLREYLDKDPKIYSVENGAVSQK